MILSTCTLVEPVTTKTHGAPTPRWVSIFTVREDLEPPGFAEAFIEAHDTSKQYGWGVLTTRGVGVIKVFDWEKAKRTMPYKWLNTHKDQPAPVDKTEALVKETLKALRKSQK